MGLLEENSLIVALFLGGLVGWMASMIMSTNDKQGCIMDILVGVAGSYLGRLLWKEFGINAFSGHSLVDTLVVSVTGACVLLFLLKLFFTTRGKKK